MKFEAPRGTQDVLPAQQPLWQRVIRQTEEICNAYGYRRITTPLFEDTELFTRTSGEGSDVVQKEMYTFTDRGDRSLTLRPEGTASVARAYVEHGLFRAPHKWLHLETTLPNGIVTTVRGVFTYRVDDAGLITNLRGYWNMDAMQFSEPDKKD